MTKRRVRRIGNSRGGMLPREVIARLDTQEGATPDGGDRLDPDFEAKMAKAEDIMRRYRDTLHRLAR